MLELYDNSTEEIFWNLILGDNNGWEKEVCIQTSF